MQFPRRLFLTLGGRHPEAQRPRREVRAIDPYSSHQDIVEAIQACQARLVPPDLRAFGQISIPVEAPFAVALSAAVPKRRTELPSAAELPGHGSECGPHMVHADIGLAAWTGDHNPERAGLAPGAPAASAFA